MTRYKTEALTATRAALKSARRTIIAAVESNVDVDGFKPESHVTIQEIDAALATTAKVLDVGVRTAIDTTTRRMIDRVNDWIDDPERARDYRQTYIMNEVDDDTTVADILREFALTVDGPPPDPMPMKCSECGNHWHEPNDNMLAVRGHCPHCRAYIVPGDRPKISPVSP